MLERASVEQLLKIEDFNPYLIEDSDELWEVHCRRRFRGRQPDELESWRELFFRSQDEQEAKFEALTKNIKAALQKPGALKKTKLAIVDNTMKLTKKPQKKQTQPNSRNVQILARRPIAPIPTRKL